MRKKTKIKIVANILYFLSIVCLGLFLYDIFASGETNFIELLGAFVLSCMGCSLWYTSSRMI